MTDDAKFAAPPRKLPVNGPLLVILVTVFLNIVGLGLILPVLPFYATAYGANGEQVALLFTMFSGLQFLTSPVFGALSDRFGRRPIILLGIVGEFVGYLILGSATSLSLVFLSRLVAGATAGNISATQAYVADITPFKERTRAYSLVGAAFGAGLLFGPALGGALTFVDSRAPAFGAGVLVALNFLFAYVALPESHPRERRSYKPIASQLNPFSVMVPLVRRPVLRGPLLATLFLNIALTGFQANFAVFASGRFGMGPTGVAGLFVASGFANIVVQAILVPRLSTRISDATLVLAGSAVNAAGNLATAFTPLPSVFWGSLPTLTGGYSLTRGPLTSLITKLVPPTEQGMANGGIQATISLAGVVGPILAGIGYESLGRSSPYWASALVVGLAALAVALRARPSLVLTEPLPAPRPANPPGTAATADPPAVEEARRGPAEG